MISIHNPVTCELINNIKSVNPQPDGSITLTLDNVGNVLSCQPDGSFQTRPKGTAGPYEKGYVSGNIIAFHPSQKTFMFIFIQDNGSGE